MMSAKLPRFWTPSWYRDPSRPSAATSIGVPMPDIPAHRLFASLKNMATFPTSEDVERKLQRKGGIRRSAQGVGLWRSRIAGSIAFENCSCGMKSSNAASLASTILRRRSLRSGKFLCP